MRFIKVRVVLADVILELLIIITCYVLPNQICSYKCYICMLNNCYDSRLNLTISYTGR